MKHDLKFEKRAYSFEVQEGTEGGKAVIVGRPIVYEKKTDIGPFYEAIKRGALDKSDLSDVRFLVNHDLNKIPLARSRASEKESTMQMRIDEEGLYVEVNLDVENNVDARALYSAVQRGDISGMSFWFGIRGEKWEDLESEHPTRYITDISTVIEVSAVTLPAYEDTEIETREKAEEEAVLQLKKAREARGKTNSGLEIYKLKNQILGGIKV